LPVDRPTVTETTALGAAYLAAIGVGVLKGFSDISKGWALERRFAPILGKPVRDGFYDGWLKAVGRVRHV
jgi:glycerol kinase